MLLQTKFVTTFQQLLGWLNQIVDEYPVLHNTHESVVSTWIVSKGTCCCSRATWACWRLRSENLPATWAIHFKNLIHLPTRKWYTRTSRKKWTLSLPSASVGWKKNTTFGLTQADPFSSFFNLPPLSSMVLETPGSPGCPNQKGENVRSWLLAEVVSSTLLRHKEALVFSFFWVEQFCSNCDDSNKKSYLKIWQNGNLEVGSFFEQMESIAPSSLCRALLTKAEICPQCDANLRDGFQLTKHHNDVNPCALVLKCFHSC